MRVVYWNTLSICIWDRLSFMCPSYFIKDLVTWYVFSCPASSTLCSCFILFCFYCCIWYLFIIIFIMQIALSYHKLDSFTLLIHFTYCCPSFYFSTPQEELNRRRLAEQVAKQRAEREAQQNKADQERVQRSVAGVNHLEIPAELAFILSKLGSKKLYSLVPNTTRIWLIPESVMSVRTSWY